MSETSTSNHRRTVARHAKLPSPSRWGQVMRFLGVGLAVVLVSGIGVIGFQSVSALTVAAGNQVVLDPEMPPVPPDIGEIEGGVNLLLAGTDACEEDFAHLFGDRCTGADSEGELNDVNLLVHISDAPRRVTIISFPRDLMIPIPECTNPETGDVSGPMRKQPLNSTFMYGGLACATKTIAELSGMSIPFAASVNWGGVIRITDAIGGVSVCVENGIHDYHTGLALDPGTYDLSGLTALQFLRTRHGVGNGGDLGRISNQQVYMSSLARKLVSDEVLSDVTKLYPLVLTGLENVTYSDTLGNPLTLMQIALAVKSVPFDEIVFLQYPVNADPDDPNKVVPDYAAADALWEALASNQPLILTGDTSQGEGSIVDPNQTVVPDPVPSDTEVTEAPIEAGVALPSNIPGQTAAQITCSNGQG